MEFKNVCRTLVALDEFESDQNLFPINGPGKIVDCDDKTLWETKDDITAVFMVQDRYIITSKVTWIADTPDDYREIYSAIEVLSITEGDRICKFSLRYTWSRFDPWARLVWNKKVHNNTFYIGLDSGLHYLDITDKKVILKPVEEYPPGINMYKPEVSKFPEDMYDSDYKTFQFFVSNNLKQKL